MTHCPICFTLLEIVETAPCLECGHRPEELEHFRQGRHTFAEMRIFDDLTLVLCDFCQVDFGSFDPTFFGLPQAAPIGFGKMRFVRDIEQPSLGWDKYCPRCDARLAFLKFLGRAREANAERFHHSA